MALTRSRPLSLALLALALLVAVTARQAFASGTPVPTSGHLADVLVPGCPQGATQVPPGYLGLSIEWGMVQHWFGTSRTSVLDPTVDLLQSLQSNPSGGGVLRIGGNSQDGYEWDPSGTPEHNGAFRGVITSGMVDAVLETARRAGWKVILGLNLRSDHPVEAVSLARYALLTDTGHVIEALELGNEPNGYFGSDTNAYVSRVNKYVAALQENSVTRGIPVVGPSLSNNGDLSYISALQLAYGAKIPFLTWHAYANRPSLAKLLADSVTSDWTNRIADVQQAAGTTPTRMDEGNSVGHGGIDGVSNVMGTNAWLVDTLLAGANAGLAGYNLHAWDNYYYPAVPHPAYYTPFVVRDGAVDARPTFYGLALLRGIGGQRFCTALNQVASGEDVKAWALNDPTTGILSVYLIEKAGPGHKGTVTVTPPPGYAGGATLSRLTDSAGCKGKNPSINGAQLPPGGGYTWAESKVSPVATGYRVDLGACETVLLRMAPG